jgi:hypothetical protein
MISNVLRQNLKAVFAAYGRATGTNLSQISRQFYGKGDFLESFLAGDRSMSIDKIDEVLAAMRAKWPKDAPWPYLRAVLIEAPKRPQKARKEIRPQAA